MDAYVQLALIEKAKRVFATDGTFLSFPLLSPLSFSPGAIAAMNKPASAADYAAAADFARIVNFVPRDVVATIDGETYLWDIYADVLAQAQVATGQDASAADIAAAAVLYVTGEDGVRSESPAYTEYRQYRDAWIVAQENYNTQRLTAEATTDAGAQAQWKDVDEPALRAAIAAAESAWETVGHKGAIEAALASYGRLAATDPQPVWREWQAGFNPDIDMLSDATSGGRYAPTGFSPRDLTGDDAWLHFDLSAEEMAGLVAGAPPELKVVLGDNTASEFEHIGFDYRSVAIVRPWFRSAVFTARTWRSPAAEEPLSDGANPPTGRCPAYVCAAIFVRNLRLTRRAATAPDPSPGDLRFTLPAQLLTRRSLVVDQGLVARMRVSRAAAPDAAVVTDRPPIAAFRRLEQQSFTMARPAAAAPVAAAPLMAEPIRAEMLVRSVREPAAAAPFSANLSNVRIWRRPGWRPTPQPTPPDPAPDPAPVVVPPSDDVSVLAFICKRLPKAPDPLPDLHWS